MLRKFFSFEIIRFAFVGVVNTFFGAALMFTLYNCFDVSYWIASACNYFFGSILSFFLNKYFTFRKKGMNSREVGYFIINILVCYLLSYGIAKPVIFKMLPEFTVKIKENIAMAAGMVLFTLLNYLGQKLIVFKKQ